MLLGLTGKAGSGKDAVAAYLVKEYNYERRAFADILKRSAAALLGIDPAEFEELKNDPTALVIVDREESRGTYETISKMNVREFLQRYGTESHREIFGNNFWVDQLLPKSGFYIGRRIVIPDCRYKTETDRVVSLGGKIVKVSRPTSKIPNEAYTRHTSEIEQEHLPVDYVLDNSGSLDDLYFEIDRMMVTLKYPPEHYE